jgi:hypothetical protein
MFRGRFLLKALFALIAIGVLVGTVSAIHRMAWWRGYREAQWVAEEEQEAMPRPHLLPGLGLLHHGPLFGLFPFVCGAGLLLKLALILLLLSLIGRLFHWRAWKPAYGPWAGRHRHWYGPWYWHHRRMHDWDGEEPFRAKVRTDAPDRDESTGDADED